MPEGSVPLADPLARELWAARRDRVPVPDNPAWSELTSDRAEAIGAELFGQLSGQRPRAWKMGAFDTPTQRRLGLDGPLVAPVLPDGLQIGAVEIALNLDEFVQPKLEAEVGIRVDPAGPRVLPCVEVADCRFSGWDVPPHGAVADFGLQGAMIFGLDAEPVTEVRVSVRHDGEDILSSACSWTDAVERLNALPPLGSGSSYVATGAFTPMLPATTGRWVFDFHELGRLTLIFS